jgi:DNA repair protein RadD
MNALDAYLREHEGNPCIVIPTGGGKTPSMAWVISNYLRQWPTTRVLVLAHIRELLQQGVDKMLAIWPDAPVGIYSAGMNRRDKTKNITYAGIQSIHNKASEFEPWDLIFVDEAHRIPLRGETMYRNFLADAKSMCAHQRVVGWTATPYRLDGGPICHSSHILNEVIYEANVKDLIDQGFLSRLRSKAGENTADVSGVKTRQGDFVTAELDLLLNTDAMVKEATDEALKMLNGRRSVLWFCVTIEHAERVHEYLTALGESAGVVSQDTNKTDRDSMLISFVGGGLRHMVNVNVLSEGFDAQRVDGVVMLRPTQSHGLYYQQAGRGLRIHPEKKDCLICDFAGNVFRHGPIDILDGGKVELRACPGCREVFSAATDVCPACGWFETEECPECSRPNKKGSAVCMCGFLLIGKNCKHDDCGARNTMLAKYCVNCSRPFIGEAREVKHSTIAFSEDIISSAEPWTVEVSSVDVALHEKPDKPRSLKVTYTSTGAIAQRYNEWICLEHEGFARTKAKRWWKERFGEPIPATVGEALTSNLFLGSSLRALTHSITVRRNGKFTEIIGHTLNKQAAASAMAH